MKNRDGHNKLKKTQKNLQIKKFDYSDLRILNTSTIYMKGIPKVIAQKEILMQPKFLSQYGEVKDIYINKERNLSKQKILC